MSHPAQLAGETELAEAPTRRAAQRNPTRGGSHRKRDRKVHPRLVNSDATHHVHEHVAHAHAHATVTTEDREHQCQPVAVQARYHPAWLLELGGSHQGLHLYE